MSTERYLSQRAFAREVGLSHTRIQQMIKSGKLPTKNGKVPLEEGMQVIFRETAKEAERSMAQAEDGFAELPVDEEPFDKDLDNLENQINSDPEGVFLKARAKEQFYKAKQREAEYLQQIGDLIPADVVENEIVRVFSEARAKLVNIPAQVAGRCENRPPREIEDIISTEINNALEAFQSFEFLSADSDGGAKNRNK